MNGRPSDSSEWIVAPATAAGAAAIAIVRLDGPGCWAAAARIWRPLRASLQTPSPAPPPPRSLTLGHIVDKEGNRIDQAMLAWFQAPHSYTGNDLVELHCHGSPAVVAAVVDALLDAGARLARPGEFTERAFFNGRIDLAQAEAVASLIASQTREAGRAALAQIEGRLSAELNAIRESLVDLGAEIEARLDFPEDEIAAADRQRMGALFQKALQGLQALLATARRGRLFSEGARIVIAGRPNTGKSSLFNALVGMERALVTPHPGTTRDTIEATIDLAGIPAILVDTAGVRAEGAGEVEQMGIDRALRELRRADLILFVIDGSVAPGTEDLRLFRTLGGAPCLLVQNKSDLPPAQTDAEICAFFQGALENGPDPLRVSALHRETLGGLEQAIAQKLKGPDARNESNLPLVTSLRHEELLRKASAALARAREAFESGASGEFVMVDLNEALHALSEILGISIDDAILSRIFAKFCIGK